MSRPSRALDDERGASSVEAVLVFPALLVLFFTIVHGAVYLHAGTIAQAGAQAAYEEARLYGATEEAGATAGYATIAAAGSGLEGATVLVARTGDSITVTVSGTAPSLLPGLPLGVTRTVTGPAERWSA